MPRTGQPQQLARRQRLREPRRRRGRRQRVVLAGDDERGDWDACSVGTQVRAGECAERRAEHRRIRLAPREELVAQRREGRVPGPVEDFRRKVNSLIPIGTKGRPRKVSAVAPAAAIETTSMAAPAAETATASAAEPTTAAPAAATTIP